MTNSRRDFLKKAALLAGGAGAWTALPPSIHKALAIAPDAGTTFYDAEHVVLLMQENRSFDHCFGMLKGVRGFNDPFVISLPDKSPVWFQPDRNGNRFAPFRLDMKDTRATWMGGVPHSWEDQVDARNEGKFDGWIEAKRPGNKEYSHIPLTMGYYTREDIPFYYALADAFTICDQHFCAALTGTTTNRSYFWTGKTHGKAGDKPKVRNGELTYEKEGSWRTFPEVLEDNGISWKVYQNEVSLPTNVEDASLLANFTDNNLEWFSQFNVRFSKGFYEYLKKQEQELPDRMAEVEKQLQTSGANSEDLQEVLTKHKNDLSRVKEYIAKWNPDKFKDLSTREKNLHSKAFTSNIGDPDYHKVEEMMFSVDGEERTAKVPKGDILFQFRNDVKTGNLPVVSWLVPPQKFSDHPSAPWYGAWYVSEVLDILTQNPDVWKKTIFILNYDENDGYFDHIPPFVTPNPTDAETGAISEGIDVTGEFVTKDEEMRFGFKEANSRTSPVGLGYRVPLIIASPWSRGGWVNSEVCDITSSLQFLEKFLSKKTGKKIEESNISSWRRTVSGDLTSAFRPYNGEKIDLPKWLDRNQFIGEINRARFKELPNNYRALSSDEIGESSLRFLPQQEPGTKPSNALKYELYADGRISDNGQDFIVRFKAGKDLFGGASLGSAFNVYAPGSYWNASSNKFDPVKTWAFAVKAGTEIEYSWPLQSFEGDQYHLRVYGPNGFFREFMGDKSGARIEVTCQPVKTGQHLSLQIRNAGNDRLRLRIREEKYQKQVREIDLRPKSKGSLRIDTATSHGWYDFSVLAPGQENSIVRCAGRVETGKDSITDPFMGTLRA